MTGSNQTSRMCDVSEQKRADFVSYFAEFGVVDRP
jgi:hypothetical protein